MYVTDGRHKPGYPIFWLEDLSSKGARPGRSGAPRGGWKRGVPMFNSLQEQIRSTEMDKHTVSEQVLRLAGLLAITIVAFGAVYFAIRFLE